MRRSIVPAALVAVLISLFAVPGTAHAAAGIPLGLPGFGDMIVDEEHGQIYLSGGPSGNGVVVTSLSGVHITTITGQYGATGLAQDADTEVLYIAQAAGDAITVIDVHNFQQVARYSTGAQTCPTHLARTENVLWFGYGCDSGTFNGGIGRIDLGASVPAAETGKQPDNVRFQRAPMITARDDVAGPLVAGQPQLSLSTVYVYDIDASTRELSRRTSGTAPGSNLNDIALDGYGETLFTGAGSRNAVPAYATADLSGRGSYHTGYHPVAVAPSPDDAYLATGVRSTSDDIYVYEIGGVQPERRIDLGNDVVLAARGLAWRPAESWLYAVTVPPAGGAPSLHVLPSL
ncbi:hypothetical protein J2S43_003226 [Catenuloplanes nepalensis]|uniref:Uncharacterized protein n=1 Tax=Catenuloplanes nepalensis TaxID=587533 RepID=A0ABT9MTF4_9ACTN|nr:hypothetical protein [Catenuloplanes nepalensis]MDP9794714.1 hypothetical protein [Catenuloplanes nepalensis]